MNLKAKIIIYALAIILTGAAVASPLRVVWNFVNARSTTISATGKTTITQNKSYPGAGWSRNLTGSGSTALNKANCLAVQATASTTNGWVWFQDADGDGLTSGGADGLCVATTTINATSWNGAEDMASSSLASTAANGGTASTVTTATTLAKDYKYSSIKITAGTCVSCWGTIKSNDANTITIYGTWLSPDHEATSTTLFPDATSYFTIYDDNKYDHTWIGDYSCTGNFPNGQVTHNAYPPGSYGVTAIEIADCKDGKRDLLPSEGDRAVLSGAITEISGTTIIDSSQNMATSTWMGQKLVITSGSGSGTYGIIESNTATTTTVGSWVGAAPAAGNTYKIIYIIPFAYSSAGDILKKLNGPLNSKVLRDWKGTRLPTQEDFYGYCGARAGDYNNTAGSSYYYSSGASSDTTIGEYGTNIGRGRNAAPNNNYIYLSNTSSEWSSDHYYLGALVFGNYGCSDIGYANTNYNYRFRAVFRP